MSGNSYGHKGGPGKSIVCKNIFKFYLLSLRSTLMSGHKRPIVAIGVWGGVGPEITLDSDKILLLISLDSYLKLIKPYLK